LTKQAGLIGEPLTENISKKSLIEKVLWVLENGHVYGAFMMSAMKKSRL